MTTSDPTPARRVPPLSDGNLVFALMPELSIAIKNFHTTYPTLADTSYVTAVLDPRINFGVSGCDLRDAVSRLNALYEYDPYVYAVNAKLSNPPQSCPPFKVDSPCRRSGPLSTPIAMWHDVRNGEAAARTDTLFRGAPLHHHLMESFTNAIRMDSRFSDPTRYRIVYVPRLEPTTLGSPSLRWIVVAHNIDPAYPANEFHIVRSLRLIPTTNPTTNPSAPVWEMIEPIGGLSEVFVRVDPYTPTAADWDDKDDDSSAKKPVPAVANEIVARAWRDAIEHLSSLYDADSVSVGGSIPTTKESLMNLTQVTVVIGQRIVTTDATTKAQTTTYSIISNPVTEILAPLPNNANVYTDQVRELEARVLNEFMKSEKGKGYNLTDLMVYNYNITLGGRRVFG